MKRAGGTNSATVTGTAATAWERQSGGDRDRFGEFASEFQAQSRIVSYVTEIL
jgi:hypothetical protein